MSRFRKLRLIPRNCSLSPAPLLFEASRQVTVYNVLPCRFLSRRRSTKLSLDDRLEILADGGATSAMLLSESAGKKLPYGEVPRGSVLTAVAKIADRLCVIIANDWTFKAGTVYPITLRKQLRAQEIAKRWHLPCIYLVDSGGAFLPLQDHIFPDSTHGGRVFYNQAIMAANGIPQVAIAMGSCTAGGAYVPTMSHYTIMVQGSSHIFLAGPPLVRAATNEVVDAESLGGARLHCVESGSADLRTNDERLALLHSRSVIGRLLRRTPLDDDSMKLWSNDSDQNSPEGNTVIESEIGELGKGERRHVSLDCLRHLFSAGDENSWQEFRPEYGAHRSSDLHTIFVSLTQRDVGLIVIQRSINGHDCEKVSQFLQLCDFSDIPVLFIHNTPLGERTEISDGCIKQMAAWGAILSTMATPHLSITLAHSSSPMRWFCGGDRASQAAFEFLWPTATIECSDTGRIISGEEYSANLWDDGIINPLSTRKVVERCLSVFEWSRMARAEQNVRNAPHKKYAASYSTTFRM